MGTWDVDLLYGVHSWSSEAEALLGLAAGTIDGNLAIFRGAVHPDDWSALDGNWRAALSEGRDFSATYRTVWSDGSVHWIEDTGRAMYADGIPVRMIGTSMDVTERNLAVEALAASQEGYRIQYDSDLNRWVGVRRWKRFGRMLRSRSTTELVFNDTFHEASG